MTTTITEVPTPREVQVEPTTGRKPKVVPRLQDWEYVERSIHRLIAAWGRNFPEWDDKTAIHRQIWEQAECVRRLRERLTQFPGSSGNLDVPISPRLENLANAVLLAPSFEDAVDGIYQILSGALIASYSRYAQAAHPIHDAPTVAMLHEILTIKEGQRLWLRNYRRRHPHTTNAEYKDAIEQELAACEGLQQALQLKSGEEPAKPAGTSTSFRLPLVAARPERVKPRHDFMPFVIADFPQNLDTRRLFWAYGYMLEQSLADDQLRWIYDAHFMPWEFLQDVSRHLWDESRHGDSGYSRLLDFGISMEEIGFPHTAPEGQNQAEPMTPEQLYESVFFIGMIAETGHFHVKREAYEDFRDGGDMESAEMMLFDIIDENTHVQYAHRWLPLLAEYSDSDHAEYKERARIKREELQQQKNAQIAELAARPRDENDAAYAFYQQLLTRMREQQPLSNATACPPRSPLPM